MKFSSQVLFLSAFASTTTTTQAFFTVGPSSSVSQNKLTSSSKHYNKISNKNNDRPLPFILYAEEEAGGESTTEDAPEEVAEEVPVEVEDPELTALKEEITKYESVLKAKRQTLDTINESVEEYTETGYARRVAQMEDVKRVRMGMQSKNTDVALASVVQNYLPILNELSALEDANRDSSILAQFGDGLTGAMKNAMKDLGVEEYTVKPGDVIDKSRMDITEERFSDEYAKGTVVRPVVPNAVGRKINSNIMEMVQVVGSLGSEAAAKEAEEAAAAKKEAEEAAAAEKEAAAAEKKEAGAEEEASSE